MAKNLNIVECGTHPDSGLGTEDKDYFKDEGLDLRKCKKLNVIYDSPEKLRNGYGYCPCCGELQEPNAKIYRYGFDRDITLNSGKVITIAVPGCEHCE